MCTRRPDMLCEQILDGVRAEATAVDVGEQRRCSSAWRFLQPVLHRSADLACERRAPFLAALAYAPVMLAGAQRAGPAIEAGDLRTTHAPLAPHTNQNLNTTPDRAHTNRHITDP